jgi:hypothetical protein
MRRNLAVGQSSTKSSNRGVLVGADLENGSGENCAYSDNSFSEGGFEGFRRSKLSCNARSG